MNTSRLDLSDIPVVDNHAHALTHVQPRDAPAFRQHFSEAHSPLLARDHVASSVHYLWALRQLADFLGAECTEDAILQRRGEEEFPAYARRLVQGAGITWLLLDEGYPPPERAYSSKEMEQMLGVRVGRMLRLETLLQDLILRYRRFSEVIARFDAALDAAETAGYVALKSIAAYRTGLQIEPVGRDQAEVAFQDARQGERDQDHFRLCSKPLIDYFVYRALRWASSREMPVQFHTGYGDPDLDLRLANPLHLRPVFEDATLSRVPIILLHESYPFTAEAAYLASAYPNAYIDVAFSLPPLDRVELRRVLGIALGTAPVTKVMVSSDGINIPEHYWLGAMRARACLGDVLQMMLEGDEIDTSGAITLARMALHDNAVRVYRLSG